MSQPFIGEIRMFTYSFAPRNWAYCSGQLLPISQNTALFSIVATTYGGDGVQSLGLPNLEGRAPLHVGGNTGTGPGLSTHIWGQRDGFASASLSNTHLPAHTHALHGTNASAVGADPENRLTANYKGLGGRGKIYTAPQGSLDTQFAPEAVGEASSAQGQAHENRQPYLSTPFCIALEGIYPSRS